MEELTCMLAVVLAMGLVASVSHADLEDRLVKKGEKGMQVLFWRTLEEESVDASLKKETPTEVIFDRAMSVRDSGGDLYIPDVKICIMGYTMVGDLYMYKDIAPGDLVAAGHKAYVLGSTDAPYGYLIYEPDKKAASCDGKYPLLVFLLGGDERGNNDKNHGILVWGAGKHGPSKLIRQGQWNPPEPMIVAAPQIPKDGSWEPEQIHEFMEYVVKTYPVDITRIYLTGISMGGTGVLDYVDMYGDDAYATALLPLATSGVRNPDEFVPENFKNIPVWIFNNDDDPHANHMAAIGQVEQINAINEKSRITLYPKTGHDAWTLTYNMKLLGKGTEYAEYDAFDRNIYEWLLQYSREEAKKD